MALVKFGGGIIQASGSIAGVTHARNRFGNYIRPRTKPVNPRSSLQTVIRSAMSLFAERWSSTLTADQRSEWNAYASAVAVKNRLGESVYLTGFNHYVRYNIPVAQAGGPKQDEGPETLALAEKDAKFAISASEATQQITFTIDDTLPWRSVDGSTIILYQGKPQLATRNFFAGPWQYCSYLQKGDPSGTAKAAKFALVEGQKIWCYGRICYGPTDPRLSDPFTAACVVGA